MADEEIARLPKVQSYWDETDVKIFCALNKKRPVKDFFDFSVLAELSGLKAEVLNKSMKSYVEELPIMIPLVAPNWKKLGLTKHYFVVRLYRMLPTENRYAIADELAKNPAWETLWQFTQASYDIIMSAYNQINDIDKLREEIRAIPGVEEIREFDIYRATRRWTCRLDEEAGFWESCIMTSDIGVDSVDPREKEIYPLGEYNLKEEGE
jgi:DNA-binding Lrp family transcriptional regulator